MKNKRILYIILPIVIFALLWCFRSCGNADTLPNIQLDGNAVNWQGNQQLPHAAQDVKGYAVTGFESLVFTANQTTQKVNFVKSGVRPAPVMKHTSKCRRLTNSVARLSVTEPLRRILPPAM